MKCWKQVTLMLKSRTVKTLALNMPKPFGNAVLFRKINDEKSNHLQRHPATITHGPPPNP